MVLVTGVYLEAGTKAVWVFNEEKAQVHVRTPDGRHTIFERHQTMDGGEILPGFQLPLAEVFTDLDPEPV